MVHITRSRAKAKAIVLELSDSEPEIILPTPKKKRPSPPSPRPAPPAIQQLPQSPVPAPVPPPVPTPGPPPILAPTPAQSQREPSSSGVQIITNPSPPVVQRESSEEPVKPPRPRATRLPSRTASLEPSSRSQSARTSLPPVASTSQSSTTKRRPQKLVPQTTGEDDAIDDFFTRKPTAVAPAQGNRASTQRRVPKNKIAVPPPLPAARSESEELSSGSGSEGEKDTSSMVVKKVVLPDWTRGASGAELKARLSGIKPNRKRRKITDPDTDEEDAVAATIAAGGSHDDAKDGPQAKVASLASRIVVSSDSDSASESDDSIGGFDDKPKAVDKGKGKGKGRGQSRNPSKSLSPPPPTKSRASTEFEAYQKAQLLAKERKNSAILTLSDSASSPPAQPQINLDFEMDPEFQAMLKGSAPLDGSDDIQIISSHRGASILPSDREESVTPEPEDNTPVTIRIALVWDPDKKPVHPMLKTNYEKPVTIETGINDTFEAIFAQFAAAKALPRSGLTFTYRDSRLYDFGTPKSLQILHAGDLRAYTNEIYTKVQKKKIERSYSKEKDAVDVEEEELDPKFYAQPVPRDRSVTREPSMTPAAAMRASAAPAGCGSDDDGPAAGTIRLSIRGSATMVLGLMVKPETTTVAQILRRYCKKFEIEPARAAKMWTELDGDRLDGAKTLSSYEDIEDETLIEVREPKS
ncbi:hypothetical protein P7C70_g1297, partial [Phenoliferia sp. Uapishka_3]